MSPRTSATAPPSPVPGASLQQRQVIRLRRPTPDRSVPKARSCAAISAAIRRFASASASSSATAHVRVAHSADRSSRQANSAIAPSLPIPIASSRPIAALSLPPIGTRQRTARPRCTIFEVDPPGGRRRVRRDGRPSLPRHPGQQRRHHADCRRHGPRRAPKPPTPITHHHRDHDSDSKRRLTSRCIRARGAVPRRAAFGLCCARDAHAQALARRRTRSPRLRAPCRARSPAGRRPLRRVFRELNVDWNEPETLLHVDLPQLQYPGRWNPLRPGAMRELASELRLRTRLRSPCASPAPSAPAPPPVFRHPIPLRRR